jgi:5-methylthioadenosine/S-adenosylhomocysteine deaminase
MQRARDSRFDAISATEALDLATLGGARALGLDSDVGSLDVGKSADLAAFPLATPRSSPVFDPASALVFAASGVPATFVAVAGRPLVRDSRLVGRRPACPHRRGGERVGRMGLERPASRGIAGSAVARALSSMCPQTHKG